MRATQATVPAELLASAVIAYEERKFPKVYARLRRSRRLRGIQKPYHSKNVCQIEQEEKAERHTKAVS